MAAYVDSDDLINFYDQNTVEDLLSDTGNYTGPIESDTKLTALAEAASGQVEAACGVSNLYSPTDLAALTGNSLALLKRLVCQLLMVTLVRRRPEKWADEYWKKMEEGAEAYLDRLRKGERLFDDASKREAGLPTIDGPTAIELTYLNVLTTRTRNYFPGVGTRLPIGRGF
jgi:hypothetical protein